MTSGGLGFLFSGFMLNALLAVIMSSVMFGVIGTMAVDNKMAFFSDALGHAATTGIALGVLFGSDNELISLIAFGVVVALIINKVRSSGAASSDTVISVFSSASIAVGLLLLSKHQSASKYSAYLVGDILSVTKKELVFLLISMIVITALWAVIYNRLLLVSINRTFASSRGIKTALYENIFCAVIAVVVMLSIRWVGILMINSLLILPAAAARNISRSMRQYHLLSVLIALVSSVGGLIMSWYLEASSSACIVVVLTLMFALTYIFRRKSGRE